MHLIISEFDKLEDDETCALLKPHKDTPPVEKITQEIIQVMDQFPEVRRRVLAKLASSKGLSFSE